MERCAEVEDFVVEFDAVGLSERGGELVAAIAVRSDDGCMLVEQLVDLDRQDGRGWLDEGIHSEGSKLVIK